MPCIHLLPETGERRLCGTCRGHVEIKLRGCAVHGSCSTHRKVDGVAFCVGCKDRVLPAAIEQPAETYAEFLPGLADPLAGPAHDSRDWTWAKQVPPRKAHLAALRQVAQLDFGRPNITEEFGLVWLGEDSGIGKEYGLQTAMAIHAARTMGEYRGPIKWFWNSSRGKIEPELVEGLDVQIIDVMSLRPKARIYSGWSDKGLVFAHCGFRYAIRLDSDCYPTGPVMPMFDALRRGEIDFGYWQEFSKVSWGRVWPDGPGSIPGPQGGQLLADLEEAWPIICVSAWIDLHRDYYYTPKVHRQNSFHMWGDQVGVHLAMLSLTEAKRCPKYTVIGKPLPVGGAVHQYRFPGVPGFALVHRVPDKMHDRGWKPKPGPYREQEAHACLEACMYRRQNFREQFEHIYKHNKWDDASGPGSVPAAAGPWINAVNQAIGELGGSSASVVDLGCGDGRSAALYSPCDYQGFDVASNAPWKAIPRTRRLLDFFRNRDKIPSADLWLLKDVLQHWPEAMIRDWLAWAIGSQKFKRLLICNDTKQPPGDIIVGQFRGLDPAKDPLKQFGFTEVARYGTPEKAVLDLRSPR